MLKLVLLLILGGALAGALSVTIDAFITALSDLMRRAANSVYHRGVAYAIWLACVSTLTTAAVALTIFISPGAAGASLRLLEHAYFVFYDRVCLLAAFTPSYSAPPPSRTQTAYHLSQALASGS